MFDSNVFGFSLAANGFTVGSRLRLHIRFRLVEVSSLN